jgi:hypothetical protein
MRDRVFEFLPLLLVVAILVGYQYVHGSAAPDLPMLPVKAAVAPTPTRRVVVAGALVTATPVPAPPTGCVTSQPRFIGGLALLRAAVGPEMGDALDCEHVVDAEGDTQQTTTTGLAYYLNASNIACFTTGYDHWALREGKLVTWTGDSASPPQ